MMTYYGRKWTGGVTLASPSACAVVLDLLQFSIMPVRVVRWVTVPSCHGFAVSTMLTPRNINAKGAIVKRTPRLIAGCFTFATGDVAKR